MTAVFVLSVGGCWSPHTEVITTKFSRFYGCPEDKVSVQERTTSGYSVSGCGRTALFYCRGDHTCKSPEIELVRRHATQFGCPATTVQVRALGAGAWEAVGCNHRVAYQCGYDRDMVVRCIAESDMSTPQSGGF